MAQLNDIFCCLCGDFLYRTPQRPFKFATKRCKNCIYSTELYYHRLYEERRRAKYGKNWRKKQQQLILCEVP